jgi:hypothetical protein
MELIITFLKNKGLLFLNLSQSNEHPSSLSIFFSDYMQSTDNFPQPPQQHRKQPQSIPFFIHKPSPVLNMYVFTQQKKVHKARQQYVWRRTLRKNKTHFRNDRILDYLFVKEREGLRERLNKRKQEIKHYIIYDEI